MMLAGAEARFLPPPEPVCLYVGPVMHARMKPVTHRFSYRVFSILLDLGAYQEAKRQSAFFSINRFNILSFFEKDHGIRDGSALLPYALGLFHQAGVDLAGGRVLLLCYPRILGYVFDPLSVYFGYSSDGKLRAIAYEVRNTFGQAHTYVEPVRTDQITPAGIRQACEKLFYVSPFNPLAMRYFFRIHPPTDRLALRILVKDSQSPILAATFHGIKRRMTSRNILALCLTIPFLTLKIVLGIHVEALRLWAKGMRLVSRPAPPRAVSFPNDDQRIHPDPKRAETTSGEEKPC